MKIIIIILTPVILLLSQNVYSDCGSSQNKMRTKENIACSFDKVRMSVYKTYTTALKTNRALKGKITIALKISKKGKVINVIAASDDIHDVRFKNNLENITRKLNFGSASMEASLLWPIEFFPN